MLSGAGPDKRPERDEQLRPLCRRKAPPAVPELLAQQLFAGQVCGERGLRPPAAGTNVPDEHVQLGARLVELDILGGDRQRRCEMFALNDTRLCQIAVTALS